MSRDYSKEPIFEQGLTFGNPAQILYLKDWNTELSILEDNVEQGLTHYLVVVTREFKYDIRVWGESEQDAISKANKLLDEDYYDYEDCDSWYHVIKTNKNDVPEDKEECGNMLLEFGLSEQ